MENRFNIVKQGYSPAEVDEYVSKLEQVLQSYRDKDSAIKNAILNAQIAADNIVQNAKLESASLREEASKQLGDLVIRTRRQKDVLMQFQADYNSLIQRYLININENDFRDMLSKIDRIEGSLRD